MKFDISYKNQKYSGARLEHSYGERINLLCNPTAQTLLAKLCLENTVLPMLNFYIEELYRYLITEAMNDLGPRQFVSWKTRMASMHEEGVFGGDVFAQDTKAIVVSLARAGIFPSHVCFSKLHLLVSAEGLRQDHFYVNRKTNAKDEVIGVDVSGSKIGGGQEDAMVFFPDPMGATGGSIGHCVSHYKTQVKGQAKAYVALHLIITPEYIQFMKKHHPDVHIYSLRLDRGLSSSEVLESLPGTYPDKEKGLNHKQYIVPGAGGVGEILNNSFV